MKKILSLLFILMSGCTFEPTQDEIDDAAARQIRQKADCERIASVIGLKGEVFFDDGRRFCSLVKDKEIPAGFEFYNVDTIVRYLNIMERERRSIK